MRGVESAVELVGPADDAAVTMPPQLVWRTAPGAIEYRIEVTDDNGAAVYRTALSDTTITVPAVMFGTSGAYRWSVSAVTATASWSVLPRVDSECFGKSARTSPGALTAGDETT